MKYTLLLLNIILLHLTFSTNIVNSQSKPIRLNTMMVNSKEITLSGFSSGGTFAQQMHFSYAGDYSGIAVFSHTYYRCGPPTGIQKDYDDVCTRLANFTDAQLYNPNQALDDISRYSKEGIIGDPKKLKNKRLYVYTGLENFLFTPTMSLRILKIFEPFIQNPARIKTVVQNAGMLLPTDSFGANCTQDATDYFFIANCGYNGPLDALQFLLPGENIRAPTRRPVKLEKLETFDQKEFFTKERHDMDDIGYIYIPKGCKNFGGPVAKPTQGRPPFFGNKPCLLHFYFHGCFTGRDKVQDRHVRNSGYLEIAETNNIIVVFPQSKMSPGNEIGCWDTYGITGPEYATRKGSQVRVVKNMMSRIIGGIQFPGERGHNNNKREEGPMSWKGFTNSPFPFGP